MLSSISKYLFAVEPQITESQQPIESPPKSPILSPSGKIKPILSSNVQWRCITNSDLTTIKKSKLKMLSLVRITRVDSEKIGWSGLRDLCKALSSTKIISSLLLEEEELDVKHLICLLHSTNHLKKLKICLRTSKYEFSEESIKSLARFRRFKHLEQFCQYSQEICYDIVPKNRELIHHLSGQLRGLHGLKELALDSGFFICRIPTSLRSLSLKFNKDSYGLEEFQKLASNIQQCHFMESLLLEFDLYNYKLNFRGNIEYREAEMWHSLFKKTSNLRILKIKKCLNNQQQPEALQLFLNGLKHLKQLTTFDLEIFRNSNKLLSFGNTLLLGLFNNLPYLKRLENLQLNLSKFCSLETVEFELLTSLLEHLPALKHFHFIQPTSECSERCAFDKCITLLANSLQKFRNLQTLNLDLCARIFDQESMRVLMNSIALKNLTSLRLKLFSLFENASNKKGNAILSFLSIKKETSFFSDLSQCTLLSHLSLSLNYLVMRVSTAAFKQLSLSLRKLKQLSSLDLALPVYDAEGLRLVMSSLEHLPNLKSLHINFTGERLCDEQIQGMSLNLAGCKAIETLKLVFCFDVTRNLSKRSLDFLLIGLQELLTLKHLQISISFGGIEKVFQDRALCEFFEGLVVLKNLEVLEVYCPREEIKSLSFEGYKNLRNMRSLTANYVKYI